MVAIPRFGSVKKEIPLHADKWNVDCIEKRDRREVPLEIRIDQRKIRADRAVAVMPMLGRGVPAQNVYRIGIEAQEEVILDGEAATRRPRLDRPIQIGARVF